MITQEQKKQLQFAAGIPHLPTDLTYECRIAIAGEGERSWEWHDNPHHLAYDLCRQVEADADRIEELGAKLAKAVDALREIEADGPSHGAIKYTLRAVLAELEKS